MAGKTPSEKLLLKPGMTAAMFHLPDGLESRLGIPDEVRRTDDPAEAGFILDFVTSQADAEARLSSIAPSVGPRTLAWIAYPKGSKAAGLDLNRDTIAASARLVGLVGVAIVAIDETWSAMRVRPA